MLRESQILRLTFAPALLLLTIAFHAPTSAPENLASPPPRRAGKPYSERVELHFTRERKTGNPRHITGGEFSRLDMVYIPAGEFHMGARPDAAPGANAAPPQTNVNVSAFWMSNCEVPLDLFDEWFTSYRGVGGESSPETLRPPLSDLPRPEGMWIFPDYHHYDDYDARRPATGLTQFAAQQFCRWLSVRTGRTYRLPTEAEWEYAARAGRPTHWPFGNDPRDLKAYAWFGGEQDGGSHSVGQKKPNPWGLYDMSGNAAEWVLDGWSDNPTPPPGKIATDPWVRRKPGEHFGVVRGGDWTSPADQTTVTARRKQNDWAGRGWQNGWRWYDLGDTGRVVGFRVVSPAQPERDGRESYLKLEPADD